MEFYEFIKGNAIKDMRCDGCYDPILKGDECFAGVLLDSKSHPNYAHQNPEVWAHECIKQIKSLDDESNAK